MLSQPLINRVAVVVGASSGMGRAIAATVATAGASVMAAARRADRLVELQKSLGQQGRRIEICPTDVTDPDAVERLIAGTRERFGKIDLLVYTTGTNIRERSLKALSHENWERMLATNLTGAFLCTQAVLPVMREAKNGLIIYLSTIAVQRPDVSGVAYQASKHGLSGLAHGTRVEERDNGIRTTIVFPGLCNTEILLNRPTPTPPETLALALDPQDVADAVLFIATLPPRVTIPEMQIAPSQLH